MDELRTGDPTELGPYRVVGRLGSGGLSVVFAAVDSRSRQVAIKVLRPHLADEQRFRNRLAREAQRILSVAGTRTVRVHEIVNEGPFVYLVMEYVEGETLEQLVSRGRRIQGPLLWYMAAGLVEAVREIHAAGIVHRDLKPSNILVGTDGIKVSDFGLGGILDEGGFSRLGAVLGSAAWLSPEQITGAPVTERSDIFNLGLILAYIALGRHPYGVGDGAKDVDSTQPLGSGRPEAMMYRIAHGVPDLQAIPSPIREVIAQCLATEPTQRPTLEALAQFFAAPEVERAADSTPRDQPAVANLSGEQPTEQFAVGTVSIPADPTGDIPLVNSFSEPPHDSDTSRDRSSELIRLAVRRRRLLMAVIPAVVVTVLAALAVVDATNVVDLGLIGSPAAATTTTTTTTSTTTTTEVPTTTTPPPPVHKLYSLDGNNYRWNPCQNPVRIRLNPTGKLTPAQQSALEAVLTEQAAELSTLTGMTIEYAGLTEEKSGKGYEKGEQILLHIDAPGQGILQDDKPFEGSISGDRIKNGFREIDSVQFQYNSNALEYLFTGDELRPYGQWLVMLMLGNAMGLDPLSDADMTAAGSSDPAGWEKEIMYFGGAHTETPTWGPGDTQGLSEVGASLGCF